MEDSLLEPRPTHSLEWAWKHSLSQDQWQELLGSLGQWFYSSAVTSEFVEAWSLDVDLLSELVDYTVSVNSFVGLLSWPLGYIIIRVQVEGVWGYAEGQVALVVPDPTKFGSQVLVNLGTLTINLVINVIKKSKIDELSISLNELIISYLLACHWAKLSIKREAATN